MTPVEQRAIVARAAEAGAFDEFADGWNASDYLGAEFRLRVRRAFLRAIELVGEPLWDHSQVLWDAVHLSGRWPWKNFNESKANWHRPVSEVIDQEHAIAEAMAERGL